MNVPPEDFSYQLRTASISISLSCRTYVLLLKAGFDLLGATFLAKMHANNVDLGKRLVKFFIFKRRPVICFKHGSVAINFLKVPVQNLIVDTNIAPPF